MAKRYGLQRTIDEMILRCREEFPIFPLPALISFGLTGILTSQLLPVLNPRLGNPATLLQYETPRETDGSIWMSVSLDPNTSELVISTSDRVVIRFDSSVKQMEDFQPLTDYLKTEVNRRIDTATLARAGSSTEILAVLAVDERVKYGLVRPIINAIATVGITDFAFETVLTREL